MGIVRKIVSLFKKRFPSHESYYLNENGGQPKPDGNEFTQLHNKIRQDIGSSMWR